MRTHIDYLTMTLADEDDMAWLDDVFTAFDHVGRLDFEPLKNGRNFFDHGAQLLCKGALFAEVYWGGANQRGNASLVIKGQGCGMVKDWAPVVEHFSTLRKAKITRVDVALDVFDGSLKLLDIWNKRDQRDLWRFTPGKPPKFVPYGDMLVAGKDGRTLYVGTRDSDTFMRIYEKGMELFARLAVDDNIRQNVVTLGADSPSFKIGDYVRLEVEFKAKTTILPLDCLTSSDQLLAGSYPIVKEMLGVTPYKRIRPEHQAMTDLESGLSFMSKQWGPVLRSALAIYSPDELLQKIVASYPSQRLVTKGIWHATKEDAPRVTATKTEHEYVVDESSLGGFFLLDIHGNAPNVGPIDTAEEADQLADRLNAMTELPEIKRFEHE